MIDINKGFIKASCDYFGEIDTATNATEECSELIQCISKQIRGTENRSGLLAFGDQNNSYVKECSYCHESINIEDYVVSGDGQYWHADCYLKEEY